MFSNLISLFGALMSEWKGLRDLLMVNKDTTPLRQGHHGQALSLKAITARVSTSGLQSSPVSALRPLQNLCRSEDLIFITS